MKHTLRTAALVALLVWGPLLLMGADFHSVLVPAGSDFSGGSDGEALTVQADGSIVPEAISAGAAETLTVTLAAGSSTSGQDIDVTTGDQLIWTPGVAHGSAGAPAITFGDANTGLFSSTSGLVLEFAANGGSRFSVQGGVVQVKGNANLLIATTGSAADPSLEFVGGNDGFWANGNGVGFAVNGTDVGGFTSKGFTTTGTASINGNDFNWLGVSYAEAFVAINDEAASAAITAGSPVVAGGTLTMGLSTSDWTLTTDGSGGTLTYTGTPDRVIVVAVSLSLSSTNANVNVIAYVALNQVIEFSSRVQRLLSSGAGDTGALGTHTLIAVSTGDDIQVFVDLASSSSNTVTADDLTITIHAIGP